LLPPTIGQSVVAGRETREDCLNNRTLKYDTLEYDYRDNFMRAYRISNRQSKRPQPSVTTFGYSASTRSSKHCTVLT